ncbi:N-6 DNA methylase [Nocardia sp. NBC_00565]|uniref:N-6 DNA methylase n=1 Tax=Nocardia sp. NBC_00565 TaxID=2975993 RepID=UPI002E7FC6D7|nr:N-6 DNA methylase [Nocardia sp. NBC_00565]WUC03667.1 N-6 DNA methylase [Nocardia sp. NBC_00565]
MTISAKGAAEQIRKLGVDHGEAIRGLLNGVAAAHGTELPWPVSISGLPPVDTIAMVGEVHQLLLGGQSGKRGDQGSYYTPNPLAGFMARFTAEIEESRLAGVYPTDIVAIDPACGAGVMLVQKAHALIGQLLVAQAAQINEMTGGHVPQDVVRRGLFADLALDCIFGVDIDPVAVDITKTALWLETDGSVPVTWMDGNVIAGNVLAGDLPPRFIERYDDNPPDIISEIAGGAG